VANPNASPSATTTYTLTVSDANQCVGTDQVVLTVLPRPIANAGPDTGYCAGTAGVVIGGNPSGSGGSGPLTYLWAPPTGLSDSSAPNPVAMPLSATTYSLIVSDSNNCTSTDVVVVTPSIPIIVDTGMDDTICPGSCITLGGNPTASGGNGVFTYSWTPGAGLNNPNGANPAACPISAITYFLVVTDGNGCTADDSVTIDVHSVPQVSFTGLDTAYCEDESAVTLTGNPTGGVFSGAGVSGNQFDPAIAGTGDNWIFYSITATNGCIAKDSMKTTVNPLPVKPIITESGDTLFVDSTYASYQWVFNGVPIFNAVKYWLKPIVRGTFRVEVTNEFRCLISSDEYIFNFNSVPPLEDILQFIVYPNPADQYLKMEFESRSVDKLLFRLVSMDGRIVMQKTEQITIGQNNIILDINRFPAGAYWLLISNDEGMMQKKIIIQ
jgi:Secretion system C-terminal sorting domain